MSKHKMRGPMGGGPWVEWKEVAKRLKILKGL